MTFCYVRMGYNFSVFIKELAQKYLSCNLFRQKMNNGTHARFMQNTTVFKSSSKLSLNQRWFVCKSWRRDWAHSQIRYMLTKHPDGPRKTPILHYYFMHYLGFDLETGIHKSKCQAYKMSVSVPSAILKVQERLFCPGHSTSSTWLTINSGRAQTGTCDWINISGLEGLKREAPGRRKCFGVLNRENAHVNEAKRRAGAYSAQYWGGN